MILSYSKHPVERVRRHTVVVLGAGIASTIAVLLADIVLCAHQFDPFGLFLAYIIPIGAIQLGLLAGAGYALASLWTCRGIGHTLISFAIVLSIVGFLAHWYAEFHSSGALTWRDSGDRVTYVAYLRYVAMHQAWYNEELATFGDSHECLGYGILAVEALGFGLGTAAPLMAQKRARAAKGRSFENGHEFSGRYSAVKTRLG